MSSSSIRKACLYAASILAASASLVTNGYCQGGISSLGISDDGTLGFAWTANSEPDLAGYKLYVGTLPGVYSGFVDVGPATTFQLTDLIRGTRYYFALTAYNASGLESDFTPEVTRQIPLVTTNIATTINSSQTNASLQVDTGTLKNTAVSADPLPPEISRFQDQWISKNRTSEPIPFTVSGAETPAASLEVIAVSSNPLVLPSSGLILEGSDTNRTLVIDPTNGRTGISMITIAVTDGAASTSVSFQVTVDNGDPITILGVQPIP